MHYIPTTQVKLLYLKCLIGALLLSSCGSSPGDAVMDDEAGPIPVIIDTDANNELDDQHALAYLLLNGETFHTIGITVNATTSGGQVEEHLREAQRIVTLCDMEGSVPVLKGANGGFADIAPHLNKSGFDGEAAVRFIIEEAMKDRDLPLVLVPVGKLTNIALALKKEPAVAERVRVVWLGANYPEPGEYNLENDTVAMNFVLRTTVPFELVTVRYGRSSGTAAVTVTQQEVRDRMPGLGPHVEEGITGRHGGTFRCFGDYSVSLFDHIDYYDEARHRALFDVAAVAIVKDSSWARSSLIPCPVYREGQWVEQPGNPRRISLWEDFDRERILEDFFATFDR